MSERRKWLSVALTVSVVVALMVTYIGTYYSTVVPTDVQMEKSGIGGVTEVMPYVYDVYRIPIDPGMAQWFFGPIHNFDRRFRPDVWKD